MARTVVRDTYKLKRGKQAAVEKANPLLSAGEPIVVYCEDGKTRMKIGDGFSTWDQLPYVDSSQTNVLEVIPQLKEDGETVETHAEAIARVAMGKSLKAGDVAYIKELICEDKYSYTGYVYNGTAWAAMDGNYSADNVYFSKDLTYTANIGVLKVGSTGSGKLEATGKNLTYVFGKMMAQEANLDDALAQKITDASLTWGSIM